MAEAISSRHILVVGTAWPPETFIAQLLRGLLANGMQITVACASKPGQDWLDQAGFHWLPAPSWGGDPVLRLLRLGIGMLRARLVAQRDFGLFFTQLSKIRDRKERLRNWNRWLPYAGHRWDAIYFPWNSAAVSHLPLFDLGMPVVVSCRGAQVNIAPHNIQRQDLRSGLSITFQKATAVHCVSEVIRQEAILYGMDAKKAVIIHPAVDTDYFNPQFIPAKKTEKFRVITTGAFIWRKGYEYALMAIRELVDQGLPVEFNIIGDGPERQRILYTIQDLGLMEHVKLAGKITPEQVRKELQQADVFLLSSLSEGISNAALEAMACGLPIVTTDSGGMREAVTDGVEGFVTSLRDPSAMAEALKRLWDEPKLRQRMGRAGRARVFNDFNLNDQICQWVDLFFKLIPGR